MILVINTGSSSIKYKLYQLDNKLTEVQIGSLDGLKSLGLEFKKAANKIREDLSLYKDDIKFIAYRVVHSGGKLKDQTRATESVIEQIKKFDYLAPLHNLRAVLTIESFKELYPKANHLCYFDTTFFEDLPEIETIYPISKTINKKFAIKKFGFHGISHQFAYQMSKAKYDEKVITLHLGAGCSVCAISKGKPIATSMGFTPLSGLVMQTRSGDIDPGLVLFLSQKLGLKGAKDLLYKNSGLAGLTETTGEMLDVLYLAGEKIEDRCYVPGKSVSKSKSSYQDAKEALNLYCNSIVKYIGAYHALLGGLDRIIFSGKIGFGSSIIRRKVLSKIKFLKVRKVNLIEPNEELAIAKKVAKIVT